MIDTSKWKEFVVSELFTIKAPASRTMRSYKEGNVPYVSSGSVNNGIISYLKPMNEKDLEKGGCITVSPLDGTSFYQKKDFLGRGGAGSAISMLYNDELKEMSALFICTVIKISAYRYGYNDALTSDNLKSLRIKLPAKMANNRYVIDKDMKYSSEGYIPDWKAMENYMKKVTNECKKTMTTLQKAI